jgi:hypothetical protein
MERHRPRLPRHRRRTQPPRPLGPKADIEPPPVHHELIEVARRDVLNRLPADVQGAETVACTIEHGGQRTAPPG